MASLFLELESTVDRSLWFCFCFIFDVVAVFYCFFVFERMIMFIRTSGCDLTIEPQTLEILICCCKISSYGDITVAYIYTGKAVVEVLFAIASPKKSRV